MKAADGEEQKREEEAAESRLPEPDPAAARVTIDEVEKAHAHAHQSSDAPAHSSPTSSPPASPLAAEASAMEDKRSQTREDYYSSRPRYDRLGNPIPDRKRAGAMSAVYGNSSIKLPGDLGARDPRRPRSPAPPTTFPGDLGPNDPRRPRSTNPSPAPTSRTHSRQTSLEGSEPGGAKLEDVPRPGSSHSQQSRPDSESEADADNDNETDDDASARGRERKRPEPGRTTSGKAVNLREGSVDSIALNPPPPKAKPDPTKGQSKFNFQIPKDPKIRVTPPGEKEAKKRVHPSTAFDAPPNLHSGYSTPGQSDDEEIHSELRAAQKLSLTMSAIHSTPSAHRVIRQIIRGDYAHFQREAEEGRKRQRMYLVATDLSPEAEYALEWTIGTVLRDGDTLFAVYASDEDSVPGGGGSEGGVEIGHGAASVRDTAAIVRDLPTTAAAPGNRPASPQAQQAGGAGGGGGGGPGPSPLSRSALNLPSDPSTSHPRSRSRGVYSAAETERRRAIETITNRCTYLLRKTRLQVRVVVEVFHCKSPRHMITEVIDFLSPTLTIIGSRGRSNVKGVLLGSFSNYLVTKSSTPVMVARKKLRKHGKGSGVSGVGGYVSGGGGGSGGGVRDVVRRNRDGTAVPYSGSGRTGRFSNVIEAPKGHGLRVQGWDKVGID
ncbi:adenine nucleotide alpha hydrolases-like protein [Hortaea werneckii]|nr:adenine nucleotide alpha hydrolases-like protein [Hortaea werneckii]KAI6999226.1 adenine nucleotide alpha hydrolases-like protein [Hortaea werneckii]KAI7148487.1 adenine nucleotide alpha hydrolases-like protein [Hortaea werneckii]KAI7179241.1 adenine nucleotide alpha hydrolases-like protein [Hortaea werneckii]KAI7509940.1 adenine nucleotide alpha hydrolases-like protein [Hortaea werneckii]